MSRAFDIRTKGLYKKGNTLFNLLHPRVFILVQPEDAEPQGYASHSGTDWPELDVALKSMRLHPWHLLGPDHFDTVADRFNEISRSSSASISNHTTACTEDLEGKRLLQLLDTDNNVGQETPYLAPISNSSSVSDLVLPPQVELFLPPYSEPISQESTGGRAESNADDLSTIVRRRKASASGAITKKKDNRRRKIKIINSKAKNH